MFKIINIVLLNLILTVGTSARTYDIRSFGAVGDGVTLNTNAIQKAIDQAHADGGGIVWIPSGKFVSGSIVLKTGVELYLDKKAELLGSLDARDYKRFYKWLALILAENASHISIRGKGTIDGRGAELGLHVDSLFYAGQIDSHRYHLTERRAWHELRPHLIDFVGCRFITITGVLMKNASSWVQSYEKCYHIRMDKIVVDSDAYWNNDGIDIIDCQNVQITNCFVNASDDGICIKSEDFSLSQICDSIYISDCTVRSSASAVKFGTSLVSGARNVVIRNIKIYDTFRSAIAIEATQGGFIENVLVENITAKNTGNAIFLRIGRVRGAEKAGPLRNVVIRNLKVEIPFENPDFDYEIRGPNLSTFHNVFPSSITGNQGVYVENVHLEDITITYPGRGNKAYANLPLYRIKDVPELETSYPEFSMFGELPAWGFYVRHVKGLSFKNIKLKIRKPDYRPAMVFDDVHMLSIDGLQVKGDDKTDPIFFKDTTDISVSSLKLN
ncbi:MAG: right-handed parallel beta-helix repeat-containing protein [Saprospiraceae bacterium]|nr:right-handed parallel beta-helix repeat-containing protein [Saprospiraceae bacterium]